MLRRLVRLVHSILFPNSFTREVVETLSYRDMRTLMAQTRTRALCYHHPSVRALMWEVKYHSNERAATLLAYALSKQLENTAVAVNKNAVLIPIPISSARMRERGYNQVEVIIEKLPLFMEHVPETKSLLTRTKHTKSQTGLTKAERLHNLFEAFSVADTSLRKDVHIALIDDTLTTGATLRSALRALRLAGYQNVTALAVAH